MKIKTGHPILKNVAEVDADAVLFVVGEGDNERAMFEVSIGKDGRSIEVRAPDTCFVNGTLYANKLRIEPCVSNSITISCPRYDD